MPTRKDRRYLMLSLLFSLIQEKYRRRNQQRRNKSIGKRKAEIDNKEGLRTRNNPQEVIVLESVEHKRVERFPEHDTKTEEKRVPFPKPYEFRKRNSDTGGCSELGADNKRQF